MEISSALCIRVAFMNCSHCSVFVNGCVSLEAKAITVVDEMLIRFGNIVASGVTVGDYLTTRWGHKLADYSKDSSIG